MSGLGFLSGVSHHFGIWREAAAADRARPKAGREVLERQFLPAAVEIMETPASPVGRATLLAPMGARMFADQQSGHFHLYRPLRELLVVHRSRRGPIGRAVALASLIWGLVALNATAQDAPTPAEVHSTLTEISQSTLTDNQGLELLRIARFARRFAWDRPSLTLQIIINRRWYKNSEGCVQKFSDSLTKVASAAKLHIVPDLLVLSEGEDDKPRRVVRPSETYDLVVFLSSSPLLFWDVKAPSTTDVVARSALFPHVTGVGFDGHLVFSAGSEYARHTSQRHRAWLSLSALLAGDRDQDVYDKLSICAYSLQFLTALLGAMGTAAFEDDLRSALGRNASRSAGFLHGQVLFLRLTQDPQYELTNATLVNDLQRLRQMSGDLARSLRSILE